MLTLPVVVGSLVISAAGELIGYLAGSGDSMERLSRMELHKELHVTRRERQQLGSSPPVHAP